MADRIRVLDENVINRIAAGEVVERPVSVVKELVENSIDAHASHIRVDVENGGKKLIRVRDDGAGMSHDDAFLALERHATSKLQSEKDLVGIATMGFRGEALASIASVSRLRLVTNDDSSPEGTEVVIEGGALRRSDRIGVGKGTVVEVRDLFYNVPVRRKFLKGSPVEAGHIQELAVRYALAFPSIGLTYLEDGKGKIDAPPAKSTFERIHRLYSKDVKDNLAEIAYSVQGASLSGFVARPPYARSNMRSVLTFVNGRAVRDRLLNSAITRAFANLVERGRYPFAILFITLPPQEVDVNVHPQKAEVRFVKPALIFNLILDGVYQALTGAPFNPPPGPSRSGFEWSSRDKAPRSAAPSTNRPEFSPEPEIDSELLPLPLRQPDTAPGAVPGLPREPEVTAPPAQAPRPGRFSSLTVLGRLPGSFLVLHSEDELIIMDHHAAHERVLFNELVRAEAEGSGFASQDLLLPRVLEFSAAEAAALARHLKLLQGAGFRIEAFGGKDFVVKGVPTWLDHENLETLFGELVEAMLDTGVYRDPDRLKEELLKRIACRAPVKESKKLQPEEIRALLNDLDRHGQPEVCPHGRPFCVRFPFAEIRRKMGR